MTCACIVSMLPLPLSGILRQCVVSRQVYQPIKAQAGYHQSRLRHVPCNRKRTLLRRKTSRRFKASYRSKWCRHGKSLVARYSLVYCCPTALFRGWITLGAKSDKPQNMPIWQCHLPVSFLRIRYARGTWKEASALLERRTSIKKYCRFDSTL